MEAMQSRRPACARTLGTLLAALAVVLQGCCSYDVTERDRADFDQAEGGRTQVDLRIDAQRSGTEDGPNVVATRLFVGSVAASVRATLSASELGGSEQDALIQDLGSYVDQLNALVSVAVEETTHYSFGEADKRFLTESAAKFAQSNSGKIATRIKACQASAAFWRDLVAFVVKGALRVALAFISPGAAALPTARDPAARASGQVGAAKELDWFLVESDPAARGFGDLQRLVVTWLKLLNGTLKTAAATGELELDAAVLTVALRNTLGDDWKPGYGVIVEVTVEALNAFVPGVGDDAKDVLETIHEIVTEIIRTVEPGYAP